MREILIAIGEDPDRDGLLRTPRRVAEMYARDLRRSARRPGAPSRRDVRSEPRRDGHGARHPALLVVRTPPRRRSTGTRTLRTSPDDDGRITGLSKLARLVDGFAKRPAGAGTAHDADRRRDRRRAPAEWRVRDDRGRAPVHVDARGAQAGHADGHFGRSRAVQGQSGQPAPKSCRFSGRPSAAVRRPSANLGLVPPVSSTSSHVADLPRRALMGVVNVTPDSFSDGGALPRRAGRDRARPRARARPARRSSTSAASRPGPAPSPVAAAEELRRVLPVVRGARRDDRVCPLSIDTTKAVVARGRARCRRARWSTTSPAEPPIPRCCRSSRVRARRFVVMHMRGTRADDAARDALRRRRTRDVGDRVAARVDGGARRGRRSARDPRRSRHRIREDAEHNLALLRALPEIAHASVCRCSSARRASRSSARMLGDTERRPRRRHARDDGLVLRARRRGRACARRRGVRDARSRCST